MSGPRTRRIARRDQNKCGVHAGGCGLTVERKDRSLDHIVPQAFFKSIGSIGTSTNFDEDWNRQLMHRQCDNSLGGHVHGLPPFWCHCHYLQVMGIDLYVFIRDETTAEDKEHHLLLRNYVRAPVNQTGLTVFASPLSKNPKSWDKSRTLRLDDQNTNVHYLLCITPNMVDQFNRAQKERADKVLRAYKGAIPDYSIRQLGHIHGKDLSPFAPRINP
jgi:hypothetical protein